MARLVIFDKDRVILDLQATWLPVAQAAAHTVTLIPNVGDVMPEITAEDLLHSIGVDDQRGHIDPKGIFATGSFAKCAKWQAMLPPQMIDLEHDGLIATRYKPSFTNRPARRPKPKVMWSPHFVRCIKMAISLRWLPMIVKAAPDKV